MVLNEEEKGRSEIARETERESVCLCVSVAVRGRWFDGNCVIRQKCMKNEFIHTQEHNVHTHTHSHSHSRTNQMIFQMKSISDLSTILLNDFFITVLTLDC